MIVAKLLVEVDQLLKGEGFDENTSETQRERRQIYQRKDRVENEVIHRQAD